MMKRWILAAAASLALAGCPGGAEDDDDDGDDTGSTPAALEGSWYAGRGGTTAPYDPTTGTWGMPSGQGLVYVFERGGTYTKAFQSYESSGGCTTGFTAFERGPLFADGSALTTHPTSGHLAYTATCSPELDSDEPLTDLVDEVFTWSVGVDEYGSTVLWLRRDDGAEATFQRL